MSETAKGNNGSFVPDLKIFLSYCHEDGPIIEKLFQAIRERGWDVFWDQSLPAGAAWDPWIKRELESAYAVIVAWSKESIASEAVLWEAEEAFKRERLFQVVLNPAVKPPEQYQSAHAVDLSYWNGDPRDPKIDRVLEIITIMAAFHRGTDRDIMVRPPLKFRRSPH